MAISDLFEDFGNRSETAGVATFISTDDLEEKRLEAFENGYKSGWEDAVAALAQNHARISESLAERLQDVSFSRQEATVEILQALEPLFSQLLSVVLPELMFRSFGQHIVDELMATARTVSNAPTEILVSEGTADALRPLLPRTLPMKVEVRETPDIAPHQACLRVGRQETELDAQRLMREVREAVESFLSQAREEFANG